MENNILQCVQISWSNIKTLHHLHKILLYSHQHLLPTRSVLHHDDPSHLPHTVEFDHSGKELEIPLYISTVGGRDGGRESKKINS